MSIQNTIPIEWHCHTARAKSSASTPTVNERTVGRSGGLFVWVAGIDARAAEAGKAGEGGKRRHHGARGRANSARLSDNAGSPPRFRSRRNRNCTSQAWRDHRSPTLESPQCTVTPSCRQRASHRRRTLSSQAQVKPKSWPVGFRVHHVWQPDAICHDEDVFAITHPFDSR